MYKRQGEDLNPAIYHQEKAEYCGKLNQKRDEMEPKLLKSVLEANKPVLGICRGIQLLNACLGGTLYQDLDQQFHPTGIHRQPTPCLLYTSSTKTDGIPNFRFMFF